METRREMLTLRERKTKQDRIERVTSMVEDHWTNGSPGRPSGAHGKRGWHGPGEGCTMSCFYIRFSGRPSTVVKQAVEDALAEERIVARPPTERDAYTGRRPRALYVPAAVAA